MNETTPRPAGTPKPSALPRLRITEPDLARLREVVANHGDGPLAAQADLLEAELDRARVIPQRRAPPELVTMRSRVVVENLETGKEREITIVYPSEADAAEGRISVLAPMGAAVLGLSIGDVIQWPMPGGRTAPLRIVRIAYQPEAAGDLHL